MRFGIDVVFVDADQVVIKVVGGLRPWRAAVCRGARDVIELRAGECARLGLAAGDRLAWAAQPERPPAPAPPSLNRPSYAHPRDERTRVLLGTEDDRFLRLARFLLTRGQFDVEATRRLVKTVDLVERHRADVVVIDATSSLADAARTVAAMEALHPNIAVIVLYDREPPRWMTGLRVTKKWESLETLADKIRLLIEDARPAVKLTEALHRP